MEQKYIERRRNRRIRYWQRTYKNKLAAIALLMIGMAPVILDGDGTAFVIFALFAVPLFFARRDYIG